MNSSVTLHYWKRENRILATFLHTVDIIRTALLLLGLIAIKTRADRFGKITSAIDFWRRISLSKCCHNCPLIWTFWVKILTYRTATSEVSRSVSSDSSWWLRVCAISEHGCFFKHCSQVLIHQLSYNSPLDVKDKIRIAK